MTKDEKQEIKDIIQITLVDEFLINSKEHFELKTKLDGIDKKLCGMNENVNTCKVDVNEIIVDRTRQTQAILDWENTRSHTCPKEERLDDLEKDSFNAKAMKKYNTKLFGISTVIIGILLTVLGMWLNHNLI